MRLSSRRLSCHGDLNETFFVGNVDAEGRNVVKTAYECLAAAIDMVKQMVHTLLATNSS